MLNAIIHPPISTVLQQPDNHYHGNPAVFGYYRAERDMLQAASHEGQSVYSQWWGYAVIAGQCGQVIFGGGE